MRISPTMALVAAAALALAAFLVIRSKKAPTSSSTVVNGIDMGKPGGW